MQQIKDLSMDITTSDWMPGAYAATAADACGTGGGAETAR
jgi:hypothetical protein